MRNFMGISKEIERIRPLISDTFGLEPTIEDVLAFKDKIHH